MIMIKKLLILVCFTNSIVQANEYERKTSAQAVALTRTLPKVNTNKFNNLLHNFTTMPLDLCKIVTNYLDTFKIKTINFCPNDLSKKYLSHDKLCLLPNGGLATCHMSLSNRYCEADQMNRPSSDFDTIKIWDLTEKEGNECVATLTGHNHISEICLLSDGKLASYSNDSDPKYYETHVYDSDGFIDSTIYGERMPTQHTIKIWDLSCCYNKCISTLTAYDDYHNINKLQLLPDGKLASISYNNRTTIWDIQKEKIIDTINNTERRSAFLLTNNKKAFLVANTIIINDIQTNQDIATLQGHNNVINTLCVLPDNRLASGSQDNTIKIWNLETYQCDTTIVEEGPIKELCLLPTDDLVVGLNNGKIKIWNIKTNKCMETLNEHNAAIIGLFLLPDGSLISASKDGNIKIWENDIIKVTNELVNKNTKNKKVQPAHSCNPCVIM